MGGLKKPNCHRREGHTNGKNGNPYIRQLWDQPWEHPATSDRKHLIFSILQTFPRPTGKKLDAVIAIWPQDARVGTDSIQRNVREALSRHQRQNPLALIVVGAEIDGGSHQALDGGDYQIPVARVEAGAELHLREVKRRRSDPESPLLLVAEPTVELESLENDQHRVHVQGWHEYNPVTGEASFMTPDTVRMWLLDTDYNGSEFCGRRIHLSPDLRTKENRAVLEKILGRDRDRDAVKAVFGNVSEPFSTPTNAAREVAVRLIVGNGSVLTWRGPAVA